MQYLYIGITIKNNDQILISYKMDYGTDYWSMTSIISRVLLNYIGMNAKHSVQYIRY